MLVLVSTFTSWSTRVCLVTLSAPRAMLSGGHKSVDCIHPSTHPPIHQFPSIIYFTHLPIHLLTHSLTYPPSIQPPLRTAPYTRKDRQWSTARAPHQQPGWQPGSSSRWHYLVQVPRTWPPALEPHVGMCFGELGAKAIHLCDRLTFTSLSGTGAYIHTQMPTY